MRSARCQTLNRYATLAVCLLPGLGAVLVSDAVPDLDLVPSDSDSRMAVIMLLAMQAAAALVALDRFVPERHRIRGRLATGLAAAGALAILCIMAMPYGPGGPEGDGKLGDRNGMP